MCHRWCVTKRVLGHDRHSYNTDHMIYAKELPGEKRARQRNRTCLISFWLFISHQAISHLRTRPVPNTGCWQPESPKIKSRCGDGPHHRQAPDFLMNGCQNLPPCPAFALQSVTFSICSEWQRSRQSQCSWRLLHILFIICCHKRRVAAETVASGGNNRTRDIFKPPGHGNHFHLFLKIPGGYDFANPQRLIWFWTSSAANFCFLLLIHIAYMTCFLVSCGNISQLKCLMAGTFLILAVV